MVVLPLSAVAQTYFGHISYSGVLKMMPEYAQVQQSMADLRAKYEAEAQRGETEFQKKFVDFLQGQRDFPQTILLKRQTELQSLMDNGVEFRKQMNTLLEQAEKDMMAGIYAKLDNAIQAVGTENNFICILNTDNNGTPFLNSAMAADVTQLVLIKLGLVEAPVVAPAPEAEQSATEVQPSTEVQSAIDVTPVTEVQPVTDVQPTTDVQPVTE